MKRLLLATFFMLLPTLAHAANIQPLIQVGTPAPSGSQTGPVTGVSADDLDQAAERLATLLDGVLRNCPTGFAAIGTPNKRCVGVNGDPESLRQKLSSALGRELYGAWRSRDDQRTVYNWLMLPSGPVYLRLEPENANRTLIYLDVAASGLSAAETVDTSAIITTVINGVTIRKPALNTAINSVAIHNAAASSTSKPIPTPASTATASKPPTKSPTHAPKAATTLAIMNFGRTLQLQRNRLHGADVLSVQNRLIALTIDAAVGSKGDGWYGPNTAKAVSDFQQANGLKVTGKVDKTTWDTLFSPSARKFQGNEQRK